MTKFFAPGSNMEIIEANIQKSHAALECLTKRLAGRREKLKVLGVDMTDLESAVFLAKENAQQGKGYKLLWELHDYLDELESLVRIQKRLNDYVKKHYEYQVLRKQGFG